MFKKFSLEEKIQLKTRVSQFLIFSIAIAGIWGGYSIKVLENDSVTWLILIIILFISSIIVCEMLNKWVHEAISSNICTSLLQTNTASNKIIKETNLQEETVNKYISVLKEIVACVDSLKKFSIETRESAINVAEKTQDSLDLSGKEQKSVETNIEKMATFKQKIETIADLILELSEHIQQIGSIVGVVEDITEQTNMLALNAAVEAARAGEHGKGFAVVAGEIRKLADESKQATAKITSLIHDIQQATNSTVMATEEGSKELESGVELAHKIAQNIEKLKTTIQETAYSVDQIVNDAENQIESVTDIHSSITQLDEGLVENARNIKQNIQILTELLNTSEDLKDQIVGISHKTV